MPDNQHRYRTRLRLVVKSDFTVSTAAIAKADVNQQAGRKFSNKAYN